MGSNLLDGRVLLGWMPPEDAVRFLLEDCEFQTPFLRSDAIRLWESARATVETLPSSKVCDSLVSEKLNSEDHKTIQQFRRKYSRATDVLEFLKVNPMNLIVISFTS